MSTGHPSLPGTAPAHPPDNAQAGDLPSREPIHADTGARLFRSVFWLTLVLKIVLSALVPLTGDEAYFVLWGQNLDYGYYDHPPMCGWLVHMALHAGSAPAVLRLPAVLFSQFVGLGIYLVLRRRAPDRASLGATLYLLTPLNTLNVLITTDTPLFLFAFCSTALFAQASATRRMTLFAAAGAFLGLALLSKYFAAILALAFLAQVALFDRSRRAWAGLAVTAIAAIPFALVHVAWNYHHAWATVTFNAFSRGGDFDPWNILILMAIALYLATPAVAWRLARHWREWRRPFGDPAGTTFATSIVVAMVCFSAISFTKSIGLHWLLSFAPFLFVLLPAWLSAEEFRQTIRLTAAFSLLHVLVVAAVIALPLNLWRQHPAYQSILEGTRPRAVAEVLAPYRDRFVLATRSYSRSAVLSYHLGTNVIVFGQGSIHGRQFDLITDFRKFEGGNMLILETDEAAARAAEPFFKRVRIVPVRIEGATYHMVLGHVFRYKRYRKHVLEPVIQRYYTPPSWLPHAPCPLRERYFQSSEQSSSQPHAASVP